MQNTTAAARILRCWGWMLYMVGAGLFVCSMNLPFADHPGLGVAPGWTFLFMFCFLGIPFAVIPPTILYLLAAPFLLKRKSVRTRTQILLTAALLPLTSVVWAARKVLWPRPVGRGLSNILSDNPFPGPGLCAASLVMVTAGSLLLLRAQKKSAEAEVL